jgi:hypothetical protein
MRDSKVPEIAEHHRLNFEPMLFPVSIGSGAVRNVPGPCVRPGCAARSPCRAAGYPWTRGQGP